MFWRSRGYLGWMDMPKLQRIVTVLTKLGRVRKALQVLRIGELSPDLRPGIHPKPPTTKGSLANAFALVGVRAVLGHLRKHGYQLPRKSLGGLYEAVVRALGEEENKPQAKATPLPGLFSFAGVALPEPRKPRDPRKTRSKQRSSPQRPQQRPRRRLEKNVTPPAALVSSAAQEGATAIYKYAEERGYVLPPEGGKRLYKAIRKALTKSGIRLLQETETEAIQGTEHPWSFEFGDDL